MTHSDSCSLVRTFCCIAMHVACSLLCTLPAAADSPGGGAQIKYVDVLSNRAALLAAYESTLEQNLDMPEASYEYPWRGAVPASPDWPGVRRDTAYFFGYQFATVGALYLAPESISGWSSEDKKDYSFSKWRDNVSNPVWDEDRWWINYVLHPYWGGAYYIRARERGLDRTQAFWYSALLSTIFEYGAEALYEPVSIQDMVVTPVLGFLVGEYLFTPWRERIRAKPGKLDWSDKAALFVTDPLGVLNAEADRMLGVKTTMQLQLVNIQAPALAAGMNVPTHSPEFPHSAAPVWGLQIRIDW